MISAPLSQVLLTIPKAFEEELTTPSGIKLYYDPSYNKNFAATVVGKIAKLPVNPHPSQKKILDQLKVGDEVCFSYQVIYDLSYGSDAARFMQATEENDYYKEFINGKQERVRVMAMPKRSGLKGVVWAGMYLDKRGELIDGVQGDEETMNRWLSQFPFGKTDEFSFNNFFEWEGQDYWKCGLDEIFAIRKDGHLIAVGDRIICKPIDETLPDQFFIDGTGKAQTMVVRRQDRARILSGGKSKGLKKDEIISFNPSHVEKYEFFGKQYFLIKEQMVLGKFSKN